MSRPLIPVLSIAASAIIFVWATHALMHQDATTQSRTSAELPRQVIAHPGGELIAEVAQTPDAHLRGLMYRTALPEDHGMLFIYPDPDVHCFWMKNTPLPLTVAFLAEDGRILQTEDMTPHTRNPHCPTQPIRHALEMPQGWFERNDLSIGDSLVLPD